MEEVIKSLNEIYESYDRFTKTLNEINVKNSELLEEFYKSLDILNENSKEVSLNLKKLIDIIK